MAEEYVSIPLDISGVKVNTVIVTAEGEIHINVTSTVEGTQCHHCGKEIKKFYDYGREVKLRHLSILGRPTYLLIRPRR
jgi:transposase